MATQNLTEPLKDGTFVRIRLSGYHRARIAECLGPLGPKGARIYRVLVQGKPRRVYIEVREDQIEVLEDATRESISPHATGAKPGGSRQEGSNIGESGPS